jgi:hypothetical protein
MRSLLVKCIETFLVYIFFIFKVLNDMIVVNFYPWKSISHFKNLIFCTDFFINHMFKDIHRLVY